MKKNIILLLLLACSQMVVAADVISLAGEWRFQLDPKGVGEVDEWCERDLPDKISLPGSTDEHGYGEKVEDAHLNRLTRAYEFAGKAWYQKKVTIPAEWKDKRIVLNLERCHWETRIWIDGREVPSNGQGEDGALNSLCVPHVYDITEFCSPGEHKITMMVDNKLKIRIGNGAHSVTEGTQTNWNGVIGKLELRATSKVWIDDIKVYPSAATKSVRVKVRIGNVSGRAGKGTINGKATLRLETGNSKLGAVIQKDVDVSWDKDAGSAEFEIKMGKDARLWDEFEPNLYELGLKLETGNSKLDSRAVTFGLRDIEVRGTQFYLNGKPLFMRGTLECCVFPNTGYPDMDVESWERILRVCKEYGLNHMRFHSWCPPKAAFVAADRVGILFQAELPIWAKRGWSIGKLPATDAFMKAEAWQIVEEYGNHASFTMLCMGNEMDGDWAIIDGLVSDLKKADPRRLYTYSADCRRRDHGPDDDFYVTHTTKDDKRLRIYAKPGKTNGRMHLLPGTDLDYSEQVALYKIPLIAHELGQWVVLPDYSEIPKYKGWLEPRNLIVFRDRLKDSGMLDMAKPFGKASGKFSMLVYKEDMESIFRTPGIGGFQLLDLHDFPGQGCAPVGLLDAFWETKGIMTPTEWRQFCSPTVALLRIKKFVWTNDETLSAKVQAVHSGREDIKGAAAKWSIKDDSGAELASGVLPARDIVLGEVTDLGGISVPLAPIQKAGHYTITVTLGDNITSNYWEVWVYPKKIDLKKPAGVLVRSELDLGTAKALADGKSVLLLKKDDKTMPPMGFFPVFWNADWFGNKQEGRGGGIFCDPQHPALAEFPTDFHSNWQWYEITRLGKCFDLSSAPGQFRAIVHHIDDFHYNQKRGAIFEARVGKGKLLACSLDLETDLDERPVARQMLHSLYNYVGSSRFNPSDKLDEKTVRTILYGDPQGGKKLKSVMQDDGADFY